VISTTVSSGFFFCTMIILLQHQETNLHKFFTSFNGAASLFFRREKNPLSRHPENPDPSQEFL